MLFPLTLIHISVLEPYGADAREAVISPLALIVASVLQEQLSLLRDVVAPIAIEAHPRASVLASANAILHIISEFALVLIALCVHRHALSFDLVIDPFSLVVTVLSAPVPDDAASMLEPVLEEPFVNVPPLRHKDPTPFHLPFSEVSLVEIAIGELLPTHAVEF